MNDETSLENQSKGVYNAQKIWVGTIIGGPLVAGYMISENFKTLGERGKVINTWLITIAAFIIIFAASFTLNLDRIPNQIIPLIYTGIAFIFVRLFQDEKINAHIKTNGRVFGWGRTICITIVGLLITIIMLIPVVLLMGYSSDEPATNTTTNTTITKTYGNLKHEILFDKTNISEREVDRIADGLKKTTFFDSERQKFVDAKKVGNNFEINLYCNESIKTDSQALGYFRTLQNDMQKIFPDNKIVFNLVVGTPDNIIKRLE